MNKLTFLFIVPLLVFHGCDVTDSDNSSDPVKPGIYEQRVQSIAINDSTVTATPVGGYFSQTFQFYDTGEASIKVKSDIPSEAGTANISSYEVSGNRLKLKIDKSTTSYFQEGEVSYSGFKTVGEDFEVSFDADTAFTFEGSGIVLKKELTDHQDLDEDGDTSEKVLQTGYFQYVVLYDDL